jgi:RNA polymerase sigma-70 factor (ECF subfamily)
MGSDREGSERPSGVRETGDPAGLATLVGRIASGEGPAEGEFVRQFGPGIRTLVRRHARPGDPAIDDLCQDVVQNVLQALRRGELRDAAALPGYVRNAVVFTVRAEYRRRGRRGEVGSDGALEQMPAPDDPAASTQRQQLATAVRKVLGELTVERDRELLRRFYLDERDAEEVCAELGIEADHFRRVAHRARERLRVLLVAAGLGESP